MKKLFLIGMLVAMFSAQAQKHITKTGTTNFKASVEAFEPVEATNESTTVLLNAGTGDIAALVFVKAFHFRVALMQEHFNENYMDSDQFPKASFKGKIKDFNVEDITAQPKEFLLKGTLKIRDKEQEVEFPVKMKRGSNKLVLDGKFSVHPQDFDIEIPSIVRKKIAQQITIQLHYELVKK